MDPPFGRSNIYIRVSKAARFQAKRAWKRVRKLRIPRPTLGNVWLRLSYYEERLARLGERDREIFIENFYQSTRQVNYITMLTLLVVIAAYLSTFQYRMIGFWEGIAVEGLLLFSLLYIVWYYRMGMDDLLDFLTKNETTPDYAFRPRLEGRQKSSGDSAQPLRKR